MNIALIGYGKMGREVHAVANERHIAVPKVFRHEENERGRALTPEALADIDVCIDFSVPAAALTNIKQVAACGKNIVVGTTGWYDHLPEVKDLVREHNIGLLYASNFSIGLNLFMNIVTDAARRFDDYPQYDVALHETHHNKKIDAPSGTALTLSSAIIQNMKRKTGLSAREQPAALEPHQLQITSSRVGSVTGIHSVMFDSEFDTIQLVHTAKSRRGFALGAVMAAEWLNGKRGLYTMNDVLQAKGTS